LGWAKYAAGAIHSGNSKGIGSFSPVLAMQSPTPGNKLKNKPTPTGLHHAGIDSTLSGLKLFWDDYPG